MPAPIVGLLLPIVSEAIGSVIKDKNRQPPLPRQSARPLPAEMMNFASF